MIIKGTGLYNYGLLAFASSHLHTSNASVFFETARILSLISFLITPAALVFFMVVIINIQKQDGLMKR